MDFTTSVSTGLEEPLNLEKLSEVFDLLSTKKCPIETYMETKGFYPSKGDMLVLPTNKGFEEQFRGFPKPSYVKFSSLIDVPVMMRGLR